MMRYLQMAVLLVAIALGALILQFLFEVTGSPLSIYRKSGWGLPLLYVLTLVITLVFLRLATPGAFSSLYRAYAGRAGTALKGFLVFFAAASLALAVGFAGMAVLGVFEFAEDAPDRLNGAFAGTLALGLLLGFLVALIEEVLFRGALMRFVRWSAAPGVTVAAVLASALIFGLAHNIADPLAWLGADQLPLLIGLCLLGVLLASTYLATGSLACSIGLHAGLLAVGEILPRTGLVVIDYSPWWMGGTGDIRMAPVSWLLFAGMLIAILALRGLLHRRFAVERDFVGIPPAA